MANPTAKFQTILALWGLLLLFSPAQAAPDRAEAFRERGNSCYNTGRLEQAATAYAQAIALDPSFAAAHFNLGLTHFKLGLYYKAIVNFDRTIALSPDAADAYYSRGLAYEQAGSIKLAIADFQKAAKMGDPDAQTHLKKEHIQKELTWQARKNRTIDDLMKEKKKEPFGRKVTILTNNNEYGGETVAMEHRRGDPLHDGSEGVFRSIRLYDGDHLLRREEIYHTAVFNNSNGRLKTILWYDTYMNLEKKELHYSGKMLDTIGTHYFAPDGRLIRKELRDKHGKVLQTE